MRQAFGIASFAKAQQRRGQHLVFRVRFRAEKLAPPLLRLCRNPRGFRAKTSADTRQALNWIGILNQRWQFLGCHRLHFPAYLADFFKLRAEQFFYGVFQRARVYRDAHVRHRRGGQEKPGNVHRFHSGAVLPGLLAFLRQPFGDFFTPRAQGFGRFGVALKKQAH